MANSFYSVYEHIVFSTKHREPWLAPGIAPELHRYLGGSVKKQACIPLAVGGTDNHVHMLVRKKSTLASAELIKEIKRSSSDWFSNKGIAHGDFHWQDGYGAFSISYWDVEKIVAYITHQEKHHRRKSWEVEFRQLLIKHGEQFDERYYLD